MTIAELQREVAKGNVVMESHATKCRYKVMGAHWDEKEKVFVIEVSFARR